MQEEAKSTLSDIENFTMATVAPFLAASFEGPLQYGYKEFESPDRNTTYLMFCHKDRVLFYGIDTPKKQFVFPMLSKETDWDVLHELFSPCLFVKKGIFSDIELENLCYATTDDEIDELESIEPADGEAENDFFLRNAMWLLNPVIH